MRTVTDRNRIYNAFELIDDTTPDPEELIEGGILGAQNLLMIVGKAKVRKTMMALGIAVSLARGSCYAGFMIRHQVRVLYLSGEGGKKSMKGRLSKITKRLDPDRQGEGNLFVAVDSRYRIDTTEGLAALSDAIRKYKPGVIFLDPFIRFHGSDENSSQAMGLIMTAIRDIIDEFNVSVVLIHHAGKNETNDARGSSVINGEYDACIRMSKIKDGDLKVQLIFELRNGECATRIVTFDNDTFVFELEGQRSLVTILKARGPMVKGELVKECVDRSVYPKSSAYRNIRKAVKKGSITMGADKKLRVAA